MKESYLLILGYSLKCFISLFRFCGQRSGQTWHSCVYVAVLQCYVRHSNVVIDWHFVYIVFLSQTVSSHIQFSCLRKLGKFEFLYKNQMHIYSIFLFKLFGSHFKKVTLFHYLCNFISFQRFIVIFAIEHADVWLRKRRDTEIAVNEI